MLVSCWSAKGGSGTTVVATALAMLLARSTPGGVVLVDLAGDVPLVLGQRDEGFGVADWLDAAPAVPADGLARLEAYVAPGLSMVARGRGPLRSEHADALVNVLAGDARTVVVDCGVIGRDATGAAGDVGIAVAASAGASLLVLRSCFVALRRALDAPVRPSAVVLLTEPDRALGIDDVEAALQVPVRAEVRVDPAVARAVDAGVLTRRLPRALERGLRHAA